MKNTQDLKMVIKVSRLEDEIEKLKSYLVNTQTVLTAVCRISGHSPEKISDLMEDEAGAREYEKEVMKARKGVDKSV